MQRPSIFQRFAGTVNNWTRRLSHVTLSPDTPPGTTGHALASLGLASVALAGPSAEAATRLDVPAGGAAVAQPVPPMSGAGQGESAESVTSEYDTDSSRHQFERKSYAYRLAITIKIIRFQNIQIRCQNHKSSFSDDSYSV